jgi:transposase-like protein
MKAQIINFVLRHIYRVKSWLTGISNKPKCPWCGAACDTETDEISYDGDVAEMECDECGKDFERHTSLDIEFWTERVGE